MANEESDLRQRSKVSWLKLGDCNFKFFSLTTKIRRFINSTPRLLFSEGVPNQTRSQMEEKSMTYLKNIFKASPGTSIPPSITIYWLRKCYIDLAG